MIMTLGRSPVGGGSSDGAVLIVVVDDEDVVGAAVSRTSGGRRFDDPSRETKSVPSDDVPTRAKSVVPAWTRPVTSNTCQASALTLRTSATAAPTVGRPLKMVVDPSQGVITGCSEGPLDDPFVTHRRSRARVMPAGAAGPR